MDEEERANKNEKRKIEKDKEKKKKWKRKEKKSRARSLLWMEIQRMTGSHCLRIKLLPMGLPSMSLRPLGIKSLSPFMTAKVKNKLLLCLSSFYSLFLIYFFIFTFYHFSFSSMVNLLFSALMGLAPIRESNGGTADVNITPGKFFFWFLLFFFFGLSFFNK